MINLNRLVRRVSPALLTATVGILIGSPQLAHAEVQMATLAPDAADADYREVEAQIGLAGRLPFVGPPLLADVRKQRAMVSYWRADYASVPSNEAELAADGASPDLVFLAANAAFRGAVGRRHVGQEGARDLDGALRFYTMLLKKDPEHADGSYNYEYVVRLRNTVARMKPSSSS